MVTHTEFVSGMETQLARWDAEVDVLAAEGRKASGELRTAYDKRLKELRLSRTAAKKTFHQLRDATANAGAQMQAGMQEAWETIQTALEKTSSELRK